MKMLDANNQEIDVYSYQGSQVMIITVFHTRDGNIALVEDINTGEQFEVYKDQLY